MKTLVTGATGFVGSVLVHQLLQKGTEVAVLIRNTSRLDLLGPSADRVEICRGDITDMDSLLRACRNVEHIYHAAAYVGFGSSSDRERLYHVNVGGTAAVVNAALECGVKRLVHTSSIAALGRPEKPEEKIDEATPWQESRRNTHYARSKYAAEIEIQRGLAEGLDAVIVNPSLVFGVGRPGENTRQIVERVRRGKIPAALPGGANVVDVRDVAEGHLLAMERGRSGERYILGAENLTWHEILATLAFAFGAPAPTRTVPAFVALAGAAALEAGGALLGKRPLLTRSAVHAAVLMPRYDNRKAIEELGCTFRPFTETARYIASRFEGAR